MTELASSMRGFPRSMFGSVATSLSLSMRSEKSFPSSSSCMSPVTNAICFHSSHASSIVYSKFVSESFVPSDGVMDDCSLCCRETFPF